jgi:hypothetical protein
MVFFLMLTTSGYTAKYLFDQWAGIEGAADQLTEPNPSKVDSVKGSEGQQNLYKSEGHIKTEFSNATQLKPADLTAPGFFGKKRNFFIQVIKN